MDIKGTVCAPLAMFTTIRSSSSQHRVLTLCFKDKGLGVASLDVNRPRGNGFLFQVFNEGLISPCEINIFLCHFCKCVCRMPLT